MATSIQDLDMRFPIVNDDGTPTDYFLRLFNDRGRTADETTEEVEGAEATAQSAQAAADAAQASVDALGLDDLNDVDTTTTPPTDGQALVWVDANGLWEPGDVASGGGGGGSWEELPLTNFNFADGTTSGWSLATGSFSVVAFANNPMGGGFIATSGSNATNQLTQVVDLSSYATEIDAGEKRWSQVVWWRSTFTDNDYAEPLSLFYDGAGATGTLLGRIAGGGNPAISYGTGTVACSQSDGIIPVGTRSVRVYAASRRTAGTNCDADIFGVRVFIGDTTGGGGGGTSDIGAVITASGTQSISGFWPAITSLDTVEYDSSGFWPGSNNARFVMPEDGLYSFSALFKFAANTGLGRWIRITNVTQSVDIAISSVPAESGHNDPFLNCSGIMYCNAGDEVELQAANNDTATNISNQRFMVARL